MERERNEFYFTPQRSYTIKFQNGEHDYGQQGWYISINGDSNNCTKLRTMNTRWIYLQKPCESILGTTIKWKFIPVNEDNVYKILVGDKDFQNHQLYCCKDIIDDLRDLAPSYFVFAAPENYKNQFNKWKVEKIAGNLFTIKNLDNDFYLSAHRYFKTNNFKEHYRSDIRDNNSTWMIGHPAPRTLSCWNISSFD